MARQQRQEVPQPETGQSSCLGLIVRMVWLFAGNVVLLGFAGYVAMGTAPGVMDVGFFAVAIGLIVLRYVDITRFRGQTSEGEPATLADWRLYAAMMAAISLGLWALAKFVASRGWL